MSDIQFWFIVLVVSHFGVWSESFSDLILNRVFHLAASIMFSYYLLSPHF